MTAKVYINIEADNPADARDAMAQLLREHPAVAGSAKVLDFGDRTVAEPVAGNDERYAGKRDTFVIPEGHEAVVDAEGRATGETRPIGTAPAVRKRGEPSPGKARRTKAEIAEDEAYANAAQGEALTETKPAISETPEDRQDPNNPEVVDDAETAAADAADEAAETAAAKTGLTLDDIRATLKLYVTAYGIPAAQEDGPKIISAVCGEGKIKVSDVPDDKIEAVIAAIKAAGKANTYKRKLLVAE